MAWASCRLEGNQPEDGETETTSEVLCSERGEKENWEVKKRGTHLIMSILDLRQQPHEEVLPYKEAQLTLVYTRCLLHCTIPFHLVVVTAHSI